MFLTGCYHRFAKRLLPVCSLTLLAACQQEQTAAPEAPYAIAVETEKVQRGDISSYYHTTATLEAPTEASVVSRTAGLINHIYVEEGMRVEKGDLLADIDARQEQLTLTAAKAEVAIIEQELERLKNITNRDFVSAEQLAKLEFRLKAAKAKRDLSALKVKESRIIAPISGTLATRHVKTGNMAQPFDPLFDIVDQSELHGIVHLPEQQLSHLTQGQYAAIYTSLNPQLAVKAKVLRISPVVEPDSGTFKVTLSIPNRQQTLKAGMFANVSLRYGTRTDVITVPYSAVLSRDDRQSLFVVDNSSAARRDVKLGFRDGDQVEIVSGLSAGENLVIRGQQNLKDDALVDIINHPDQSRTAAAPRPEAQ